MIRNRSKPLFCMPIIFFSTLKESAAPYELWHQFEIKLHRHARKKCLVLDKFNGNHEALMAWLKHNRIALYLGGHAIDHELPSKIIGAFFSSCSIDVSFAPRFKKKKLEPPAPNSTICIFLQAKWCMNWIVA